MTARIKRVSDFDVLHFVPKCFCVILVSLSTGAAPASAENRKSLENIVPLGGRGLPPLDHGLKQLANRTIAAGQMYETNKGYTLSYHVGQAKVSLVATHAADAPRTAEESPIEPKEEAHSGVECHCQILLTWLECTGFPCDEVPQRSFVSPALHNSTRTIRKLRVTRTTLKVVTRRAFRSWSNLAHLRLDVNQITWLEENAFVGLHDLRILDLSSNQLRRLPREVFAGMRQLRTIDLRWNGLETLSDVAAAAGHRNLPNLHQLLLSGNSFEQILEKDVAQLGSSPLQVLHLDNCRINFLHPLALPHLKNLSTLHLGWNRIPKGNLRAVLSNMPLTVTSIGLQALSISSNHLSSILSSLAGTRVKSVDLSNNEFTSLNASDFPSLPFLEDLVISDVGLRMVEVGTFAKLTNLKSLKLDGHRLHTLPKAAILPNLRELSFRGRKGHDSSKVFRIGENTFEEASQLQSLDLSENNVKEISERSFRGLSGLRRIVIDDANLTSVDRKAFATLGKLEMLRLHNNPAVGNNLGFLNLGANLTHLSLENTGLSEPEELLFDCKKLKMINLRRNNIQRLGKLNFGHMKELDVLDLSENQLAQWEEPILHRDNKLKILNLTSNRMTGVTPAMLEDLRKTEQFLSSENNFTCNCALTGFAEFLRQKKMELDRDSEKLTMILENASFEDMPHVEQKIRMLSIHTTSLKQITCAYPLQMEGSQVLQLHQNCPSFSWKAFLTTSGLIGVVFVVLTTILYRYRWYVRFYAFLVKSRRHMLKQPGQEPFQFDAFVSYSNEDAEFVSKLVHSLESPPNHLKLCVYERDFAVGGAITDEIVEAIHKSRRTVMVLSKAFVQSQWCKWELQLAQHKLYREKTDSLIIVKLGEIPKDLIPSYLSVLMKRRIYLEWDERMAEAKKMLFWERLTNCLSTERTRLRH